ncbi:MAG: hypothetical protein PHF86_04065 [Candidatus Nanoarchaeia archaeon]|nr:hypothetical protein [Candidatus Nanoarchaeia archaeon]
MAFNLPLTQDDINYLKDTRENTEAQNQQINESSVTITTEIARFLLIDTPFKKQLDPFHIDIFEFEEELRRLNGTSIIQPLQEAGFTISNTSGLPARLYINNGRLRIVENSIEIVNVPLFPVRGYSRSQPCGINFDIWSRDRFGSTTSIKHSSSIFTIDINHRNLAVRFDGTLDVEVDVSDITNIIQTDESVVPLASGTETDVNLTQIPITPLSDVLKVLSGELEIPLVRGTDYTIDDYTTGVVHLITPLPVDSELLASYNNIVQVEGSALASTIQLLLQQADPALEAATCAFNITIQTFTIIAAHGGPTSSVEVRNASGQDLRSMLGFTDQYMIQGKYQNNLLNVEIDSEAVEIKIADFRLCFSDVERGYNNDDIGFDWTGSQSVPLGYIGYDRLGPLFCSGLDNGKDVAKSIEAQLRIKGTGGFKNAAVHYFTDSDTFIIYSGTFGTSSSVHVLPASDPDRDARSLIGFTTPQEEIGHEEFFETLQKLHDRLATVPNITVSSVVNPDTLSHSILYTYPEIEFQRLDGVNIQSNFQDFDATTTKIYDDGSRGLPRLYPNGKITIDDTNDKIDFFESTDTEITAFITHGVYDSESSLAEAIQDALNVAVAAVDRYTCEYSSRKRFIITRDSGTFGLFWATGVHATTSIANYIGFLITDRSLNGSHTSDVQVSFQMLSYFYPTFCNQFDGTPRVIDRTVDEQSALLKEEEYVEDEPDLLDQVENHLYDNETLLESWEYLAALELAKVNQEYNAIRYHRGAYANHISESDAVIIQKTTAYDNLTLNRDSLIDCLAQHGSVLNITPMFNTYVAGTDFSNGGTEPLHISLPVINDLRVYNKPAPLVRYETVPTHIPGRFSPEGLMSNNVSFGPEPLPAFSITAEPRTQGYSYSLADPDGYLVTVPADTSATIIGSNYGPFDFSAGDTLSMRIDGGSNQTATFNALPGYTESRIAVSNQFIIRSSVNDGIDFRESPSVELTTIIPAGAYTGATLATQIQTRLNAVGASNYSVNYNISVPNRFTIISDGAGGTGIFSLLWATGTNASSSIAYTIGFNIVDNTGNMVYYSENDTIFPVVDNVNNVFRIAIDGQLSADLIIIPQNRYTISTLIAEMVTQISNDPNFDSSDFTITNPGSRVRITSTLLGNSSRIDVYEGSYDFLRTVALDGDAPVYGGSDVLDINNVTVDEVVAVLNAEISGISASNDSNRVRITTLSATGTTSSVEITGGTCRTIIGFSLTTNFGADQNNKLKVDIDSDLLRDPIGVITSSTVTLGPAMAASIQNGLRALGGGGYTEAVCTFNETTAWQTFTNQLRIISGSFDAGSTVNVTDATIKIVAGQNDRIDFRENITTTLSAYITAGFYNPIILAQEIQTQMNAVGNNTYSVTYASSKFTISSDGVYLDLLLNSPATIASIMGFYAIVYTGEVFYTGVGNVKWGSCDGELGFDGQVTEPGHTLISANLTISDAIFMVRIYWADHGGGNRLDLNINMLVPSTNTIKGLIDEILTHGFYITNGGYSPAFLLSRIPQLFRIADGDTLVISANSGPNQTYTFNAVRASVVSDSRPHTRVYGGNLQINLNNIQTITISLGTQLSPEDIAAKIQQEVRAQSLGHACFALFECVYYRDPMNYNEGRYFLFSGTGGSASYIHVLNNGIAGDLGLADKDSTQPGQTPGSGNVADNCNVTANEIVTNIMSQTHTGFEAQVAHTYYVKLISTATDSTSRLQVGSSLAAKIGFDIGINSEAYPSVDLLTIASASLININNHNITSPTIYTVMRGWDTTKGNVTITYVTADNTKTSVRRSILTTRQSTITARKPQISVRANEIIAALTPALYNARKSQVNIRLNKKTGTYVKVGDKLNQSDNNQSIVASNIQFINDINAILPQ